MGGLFTKSKEDTPMNFTVLLKKIFQTRDLNMVTGSIQGLHQCLPDQEVEAVISKAVAQTATEDPETFVWLTKATVSTEALIRLGESATQKAREQLIDQGFEVGKDFVSHPEGGMVATRSVLDTLLANGYLLMP